MGRLTLVGLGPGGPGHVTGAAIAALQEADIVIGYRLYVDQVRSLVPGVQVREHPIGQEIERAREAVDLAESGKRVALVSSGDIGIYGMAAPAFDVLAERGWDGADPEVVVIPGVSAAQSAAALLGAPLGHDFCTISLSDLLTPWAVIERRVRAAAAGDFVVAFYNPRSRGRTWQLGAALDILRSVLAPGTPVGLVRNASRSDESVQVTSLGALDVEQVDMFSILIVGNSRTRLVGGRIATPRGYGIETATVDIEKPVREPARTTGYPVTLTNVRRAIVAGGGPVGERKVAGLLAAGIAVTLVSPVVTGALDEQAKAGRIVWRVREYRTGDLAEFDLAVAATGSREVNAAITREATTRGILCNVVDRSDEGGFHLPAVLRRGDITIAVNSGGTDPARSAAVRNAIGAMLEKLDA